ncbi:sulfatase-like hydrolase/transferase [Neobacillus sp. 19]|uniref:sulfatase-like hydrolase/transferase n=1 Tax=Neobacillus sp. 19 TaxID=3394458 RepID=UPI003BF6F813
MWRKLKDSIISYVITGLHVYLLIFAVEWIYRGSFNASYLWIKGFTMPFTYNFIILFLLFSMIRIFRRKLYILFSFILTVPFIVLAIASKIKLEIRGEPVLPSDFLLGSEATNMVDFFSKSLFTWLIVGAVTVIAIIIFSIYKAPNQKQRNWLTISLAVVFFLGFFAVYMNETKNDDTYLKRNLNISYLAWDQKSTTAQDGVIGSFMLNMKLLKIDKPMNYSKQTIEQIISETDTQTYSDSDKPNVIMIMSEAFWDPTVMTNVEFNKDPLPFFHKLQAEQSGGKVTVPVFGGSTVNTEFEVLTGVSTQFLPAGSIPYLNYVTKPIPALPNIFRNNGYETTGIHTFHHWFYQRSAVYEKLGFDRFESLEYIPNPVPDGNFIHDQTITDEILRKLNLGGKPNFIFAVTTQNHGPYQTEGKKPYANMEVNLKNGKSFSADAKNILEVYSDNLTEIDKQLERLITELEKSNQKTIVVFWGDHLPLLGDDYKVYREAGYYQESNDFDDYKRMFTTPLLIWDNYSGKNEPLNVGASLIGPVLLDRAGIKGDYLTNYLLNEYKNNSVKEIVREDFMPEENISEKVVSNIKQLQYDLLFGKMYGISDKKAIQPNPDYRLGYKDPKITDASVETIDGKKLLVVKGENFTGRSYVYVNNKYIARESGDENSISVPISNKIENMKIIVKVMDSNEKVLSKSNTFEIKK